MLDMDGDSAAGTLTAYFRIDPDGAVTVMAPKIDGNRSGVQVRRRARCCKRERRV